MCRNKPSELETLQEEAPQAYGIGSRTYGIRIIEWINSIADDYQLTIHTNHNEIGIENLIIDEAHAQLEVPEDTDGIPGVDIRLVSQQAGVDIPQALYALRRNNGDIVNSIMELTNHS